MKKKRWLSCFLAGALLCTSLHISPVMAEAAGTNVALNKSVKASGLEVSDGRWTEDLAVDGIRSTEDSRWSAPKMKNPGDTDSSAQTPQWLEIDLQAESTEVESVNVYFYKKVWATSYRIQTRASGEDDWEDVGTPISRSSSGNMDVTDTFDDIRSLKRYVRFYFEKINVQAAGVSVSVREIEIIGTQSDPLPPAVDTAQDAVRLMEPVRELTTEDAQVPIPEVAEGFLARVIGSDVPQVITDEGQITSRNIGSREVNLILEVTKESDPADKATKEVLVTVPDKTGSDAELYPQVEAPNEEPSVLPSIQEWYGYQGQVTIDRNSRILYADAAQTGLAEVAEQMKADLEEICGISPVIEEVENASEAGAGDIYLESQTEDVYETGSEGYFLVADEGIRIYSSTKTGALYGTVTVEQILWQEESHSLVPKGVIRDYPNYEIRGLMFDVARIPHRMQYLQDYTKILKWFKMNEFHLHLNDNYWSETANGRSGKPEDWENVEATHRLQSDTFPSLIPNTKKGERYDYYNNVYGEPFYTKAEYIDLQNLAMDQGISVVSEIDTPCHSAAYTRYAYENPDHIDWLGPIQNPGCFDLISINTEAGNQTEKENAVRARRFMKELLEEYIQGEAPVFLGDTVHIGMDEYDFKNGNQEAFRQYINYLSDIVKKHGKKVRMWGALKVFPGNTEVAKDIVLDEWATYEDDPIARMKEGYSVVNVPQPYLYTTPGRWHKDMLNEQYIYDTWDPTVFNAGQGAVAMKGEPKLLGAKAAIWGDEQREGIIEADLHERALRAAAMISEKTWGGTAKEQTFTKYEQKLDRLREGPGTEIAMSIESQSDLILDYQFGNAVQENGTIKITDTSGNDYDGTANGGAITEKDGKTMLKLDGNQVLETPLTSLRYPYTVSFDIAADSQNPAGAILFDGYDGRLSFLDDQGTLGIHRSFYRQELGYQLPPGEVHRVTLVGTYQTTKLYVDGEFVNMLYSTDSGSLTGDFFSSFVFPLEKIGKGFNGYLGDLQVYQKALMPEELRDTGTKQVNAALNARAYQENGNSSYNTDDLRLHPAWKATDGDGRIEGAAGVSSDPRSYWNSSNMDSDALMVDFGSTREISSVEIQWVAGKAADSYGLEFSADGEQWTGKKQVTGNSNVTTIDTFEEPVQARYMRMQGIKRKASDYGIQEIKAYEQADKTLLKALIRKAEEKAESGDSTQELSEALAEGKLAVRNVTASKTETDRATARLHALVGVDFADLTIKIQEAKEYQAKDYTEESFAALAEVIKEAESVAEDADEEILQEMIRKLEEAIAGLKTNGPELSDLIQTEYWEKEKAKGTLAVQTEEDVWHYQIKKNGVWEDVGENDYSAGNDAWLHKTDDNTADPDYYWALIGKNHLVPCFSGQTYGGVSYAWKAREDGYVKVSLAKNLRLHTSMSKDPIVLTIAKGTGGADSQVLIQKTLPVGSQSIDKDEFTKAVKVKAGDYIRFSVATANNDLFDVEPVIQEGAVLDYARQYYDQVKDAAAGGNYTEESAAAFEGALHALEDALQETPPMEEKIDKAIRNLETAVEGLTEDSRVAVTEVKLDKNSILLSEADEKAALKASVLPANADNKQIIWSSSKSSAAEVSQEGIVTAKANGTTVIKAASAENQNIFAECAVTVEIKEIPVIVPVTGITLDRQSAELKAIGETISLKASILPEDAANQKVLWESANPEIASVTEEGLVTAVSAGSTAITVRSEENRGITAVCQVTVTIPEPAITCQVRFDATGGTASFADRTVENAGKLGTLPAASRAGYEFLGWFTARAGGTKASETMTVTGDMTLYAQWKKIEIPGKITKQEKIVKRAILKWNKVKGASRYKIYMKTGKGKYKKIAAVKAKKRSYTKTGLKASGKYKFKVVAGNGKKAKLKTAYKKNITVTWKNVAGYEGYEIHVKAGSGKYQCKKTVKKGGTIQYTLKNAKAAKKYKFLLKGYVTKAGKKMYKEL